jgi:hypothetical protein
VSELVSARIREYAGKLGLTHLIDTIDQLTARAWAEQLGYRLRPAVVFLIEATGNDVLIEAYRKLLVREYMGQVLTPSVNLVGDTTKEHIDIVDAFERGDFEALRRVIAEHTDQAQGDDSGRDQKPGSAG